MPFELIADLWWTSVIWILIGTRFIVSSPIGILVGASVAALLLNTILKFFQAHGTNVFSKEGEIPPTLAHAKNR